MLIIAGTTLIVYPAASFVNYYKGNKLILINLSTVPREEDINYVIHDKVGVILDEVMKKI